MPNRMLVLVLALLGAISAGAASRAQPSPESALDQEPLAATRAADLRTQITYGGDRILILTPGAFYRLHPESEAWTRTTSEEGLPLGELTALSVTADDLWITGTGCSVSDIRFDDWQRYAPGEGYPGRVIHNIESDEDYAYAATDGGAGRFDRYVLEWESLAGPGDASLGAVNDVAVGETRVWFALAGGIAEFRKDAESFRLTDQLGGLAAPHVLTLRQTPSHLWAITDAGVGRFDKELETWTGFAAGAGLPDARIHQATLIGEDLWLATDAGLWSYRAESGIWREDEFADQMPGRRVFAFAREPERTWVVTEEAFAVYDEEEARWIDFTTSVPITPREVRQLAWVGGLLVFLADDRIVYALPQGEDNPSLFAYRVQQIEGRTEAMTEQEGWEIGLTDSGLGAQAPNGQSLALKGGATIYIEDEDQGRTDEEGLGDLAYDTRIDITLNGRLASDRTISGFYDNTDPDNEAYQISYRGARDDVLRNLSAGEVEQELFNTELIPDYGLRGGWARVELGARSERTRRRWLTADAWGGERRTFPGRDVFYGGSNTIAGSLRDVDYVRQTVFAPPDWSAETLAAARIYRDDGRSATDDANTFHGEIAGRSGSWDLLAAHRDYLLGPRGETLILVTPLEPDQALAAVATVPVPHTEWNLTPHAHRNRYALARDPIPSSLAVAIRDSSGAQSDASGNSYLHLFGLDDDDDGRLDPERFSPLTGLLSFPDSLPFPAEVYAEEPTSLYWIDFEYRSHATVFQLSERNLVPGSEEITVDRERLQANADYTLVPSTGLFVLFEHIVLDEDSVIEVDYTYEIDGDAANSGGSGGDITEQSHAFAGQLGLAPDDHLFLGVNATRWEEDVLTDAQSLDLNARLEWKGAESFLRVMPEIAFSQQDSGATGESPRGTAAAAALQSRFRNLELTASYRNLGADFISMENRRTLLGRLREESRVGARWDATSRIQALIEWDRRRSDQLGTAGAVASADSSGSGHETSLIGTLRLLRAGLPNLELRQGQITSETPGGRREKRISRAELEINPDARVLRPLGVSRLWLRSYFQRSERRFSGTARGDTAGEGNGSSGPAGGENGDGEERRITDQAYVRLNGAAGNPLSWNVLFEDRRTHRPDDRAARELRRFQRLDAALQTRPHTSVDGYLRWESSRDLFWERKGGTAGFDTERLLLAYTHFYPGRLMRLLAPLSFRLDLSRIENERGEPGVDLPGASSLLRRVGDASDLSRSRGRVLESRLQLLSWLRVVERWEDTRVEQSREGLDTENHEWGLENRLEIRPRGGLLTLRLRTEEEEEGLTGERDLLQFHGDWDQAWGGGWLTYASLQVSRGEQRDRLVAAQTDTFHPQARITLRRNFLRLDANVGVSYTLTDVTDISTPATGGGSDSRLIALTTTWSIHPHRILNLKLQYALGRLLPAAESGDGSPREWRNSHDLKLRVTVRV